jgi:DNA modification methylase
MVLRERRSAVIAERETTEYDEFLAAKTIAAPAVGFGVLKGTISGRLFPFQRDITRWALQRGRAAIFSECGTGKTPMQLEWGKHVAAETGRPVLILAPLAVAQQTRREGEKFDVPVTVCRTGEDVRPGVNVTNYEMLEKFDPAAFSGVVLDESSILKAFMGSTKRRILSAFERTPYKLACTATPAPNDHLELGNHAEFLGVMPSNEMISRWFINDTMSAGKYRLKGHAEGDFWAWVSSWAVSLTSPADLGYPDAGFVLPPLEFVPHIVDVDLTEDAGGALFRMPVLSATTLHQEGRRTVEERAARVAALVQAPGPWVVWCNTNYEADALRRVIPEAVEVRGDQKLAEKERLIEEFTLGQHRILITKPSICGFGMNWQHVCQMAFVGLSYSYEQLYQALRRSWRFGQERPVTAHIVMAESEGSVMETIRRKQGEHEKMKLAMNGAMQEMGLVANPGARALRTDERSDTAKGEGWELRLGDCCRRLSTMQDASAHLSIYSPPFSNLYIYSDHVADMGNSQDDEEFFEHYKFLLRELHRVTVPGRLSAVHCKDLPLYKGRDGAAGLRDFPGQIIRAHEECGWTYHSRITIWKDPVIEMQRTKNHGLLYCNLRKNSCGSRAGMADYVIVFRKWQDGIDEWPEPVTHTHESFNLDQWQRWASPVWMDIQQTNVLNYQIAREDQDEKHICPLQLDVIERLLVLYSNPGDLVVSPFSGIGSEGYMSVKKGRRFLGTELKPAYFEIARRNLERAEAEKRQVRLFDDELEPVA